jgi:hypothetical protein
MDVQAGIGVTAAGRDALAALEAALGARFKPGEERRYVQNVVDRFKDLSALVNGPRPTGLSPIEDVLYADMRHDAANAAAPMATTILLVTNREMVVTKAAERLSKPELRASVAQSVRHALLPMMPTPLRVPFAAEQITGLFNDRISTKFQEARIVAGAEKSVRYVPAYLAAVIKEMVRNCGKYGDNATRALKFTTTETALTFTFSNDILPNPEAVGTGRGTSIAARFCELMDATFSTESKDGKFYASVTMPFVAE